MSISQSVSAYSIETHSKITQRIVEEYNNRTGDDLTRVQEQSIIQGVIDEDELMTDHVRVGAYKMARRAFNHFYNPLNGGGLNAIVRVPYFFDTKASGMASVSWATDIVAQAEFGIQNDHTYNDKLFGSDSDYSWQRAIYEYAHGDKQRGMEGLGHILHLVEDLTVPAHVRNDPHPPFFADEASPYEAYTKGLAPTYDTLGKIPKKNTLNGIMHELALHTGKYYLSRDTIFTGFASPERKGLQLVQAAEDGAGNYFGITDYGYLVRIKKESGFDTPDGKDKETYFLTDSQDRIMASYYKGLSGKAVEYGIATIRLFFKEVEEERRTKYYYHMNKSKADIDAIESAILNFDSLKQNLGSSLSSQDAYELNREDWDGARRAAATLGTGFTAEPGGDSVLAEPVTERTIKHDTAKVAQPKQQSLLQLKVRLLPTIIRGTDSGVNEVLNPGDPNYPDYEQMGAVLLSLESILQELMLKFQKPDKCANKDLSIFKLSTCVDPFEEGGFAFGAGSGEAIAPPPFPDGIFWQMF